MPGSTSSNSEAVEATFAASCDAVWRACRRIRRRAEQEFRATPENGVHARCEFIAGYEEGENCGVIVRVWQGAHLMARVDEWAPKLSDALKRAHASVIAEAVRYHASCSER